jgi:hypothetical protein
MSPWVYHGYYTIDYARSLQSRMLKYAYLLLTLNEINVMRSRNCRFTVCMFNQTTFVAFLAQISRYLSILLPPVTEQASRADRGSVNVRL